MFFYLKKSTNIFRNSSGAVAVSVGSVQFQIAPPSSLHYSISTGPFWCSGCHLQGFYSVALVPSEVVPFVYLASVCWSPQCLVSALTQAGGGRLLFRCCFPLYAAQAPGCSIWSGPCIACGSSRRVFHKSVEQKAAPAFCAFPA